jgi:hypothetical protein
MTSGLPGAESRSGARSKQHVRTVRDALHRAHLRRCSQLGDVSPSGTNPALPGLIPPHSPRLSKIFSNLFARFECGAPAELEAVARFSSY